MPSENPENDYTEKVRELAFWIDYGFLKNLMEANFDVDVEIIDHDVTSPVNAGDNYLSTLYRTTVEYKELGSDEILVKRFMIKGEPPTQAVVEIVEHMELFKKEIFMYSRFIPAIYDIFQEYFPSTTPFISPYSYKCLRRNTIVMEDLGEQNYRMADRLNLLDFGHSIQVLKAMARLHATSFKVLKQNPEFAGVITKDIYIDNPAMTTIFQASAAAYAELLKSWEGCERFVPLFKDFSHALNNNLFAKFLEPGYFNVLNHGDVWVNNVLFLYNDDGKVDHAKLVDYQLIRIGTPVLDLLYFIFSSVQKNVILTEMNILLREYYSTLMDCLAALNVDADYTFSQLREEFETRLAFGLFAFVALRPVMLAETKFGLGEEDSKGEDNLYRFFNHPPYKTSAQEILNYLDSIGYLTSAHKYITEYLETIENPEIKRKQSLPTINSSGFFDRILTSISRMMHEPLCT